MAKLIVISWRDVPAQVLVKKGRETAKVQLSHRFQEAVDRAAMRAGKSGSDAYLADWKRSEPRACSDDIQAEERGAHGIKDDGGEIVIEHGPAAVAIRAAFEEDLEAVVTLRASDAAATGAEQRIEFGRPLRMRGAAQAETMREETGPVFTRGMLRIIDEAFAPEVFFALLAVGEVGVAKEPRGDRLVMFAVFVLTGDSRILLPLRGGEAVKGGHCQLARIPRMICGKLWITDGGAERRGEQKSQSEVRTHAAGGRKGS